MKKLCAAIISMILILSIFSTGRASKLVQPFSAPLGAQRRGTPIKFVSSLIRERNRRKRQDIKARYPQAVGAARDPRLTKLNQELKKFIDKEVNKFRREAVPPEERTFSSGSTFEARYSVRHAADRLLSIAFLIQAYYEGAVHGTYNTIVFNYDLDTGRSIRLADLFRPNSDYLKPISDYSIEALMKEKGDDSELDAVRSGAGPAAENYRSWNFTRAGLEVNFDPYQVGSYAEGPHEVVIPYSVLRDVIAPAGPLSRITGRKQ